jgi:single-stranded-DNA-specific exonuclease
MEPFGPENQRPVFCMKALNNIGSKIVKNDHVRFDVEKDGFKVQGIGFNLGEKFASLPYDASLDIVFTLEENHYNNRTSLQMKVIDFKSSH